MLDKVSAGAKADQYKQGLHQDSEAATDQSILKAYLDLLEE